MLIFPKTILEYLHRPFCKTIHGGVRPQVTNSFPRGEFTLNSALVNRVPLLETSAPCEANITRRALTVWRRDQGRAGLFQALVQAFSCSCHTVGALLPSISSRPPHNSSGQGFQHEALLALLIRHDQAIPPQQAARINRQFVWRKLSVFSYHPC